jgi:hypothetical protein
LEEAARLIRPILDGGGPSRLQGVSAELSKHPDLPALTADCSAIIARVTPLVAKFDEIAHSDSSASAKLEPVFAQYYGQIAEAWNGHQAQIIANLSAWLTARNKTVFECLNGETPGEEGGLGGLRRAAKWLFDEPSVRPKSGPKRDNPPEIEPPRVAPWKCTPVTVGDLGDGLRSVTKLAQEARKVAIGRHESWSREIARCREAAARKDQDLRRADALLKTERDEKNELQGRLNRMREARASEFALVRQRMEQKLAKVAEIHRLEVAALLAS